MSVENELRNQIKALEVRVKKLEDALLGVGDSLPTKKKKASAREFLMTKTLKADTQKVLALGYYLEYMEGMESFNVTDLEVAFRSAKETPPRNINDAVNKNIVRGFLMDAGERKGSKKAWCLTSTGEQFLETELSR